MNTELTPKEKAYSAISEYLKAAGWQQIDLNQNCDTNWFQWVDPLTGTSHRSDFAFVIQTDRELIENILKYEKKYPKTY